MQFYFSGSFYSSLPTMKWGFFAVSSELASVVVGQRKSRLEAQASLFFWWHCRPASTRTQDLNVATFVDLVMLLLLTVLMRSTRITVQSNALLNIVEWIRWICLGCVWKQVTCPFLGEEADFEAVIKFFLWYNFTLTKISILRSCSRSRMYNLSCGWLVWSTLRVWVDNSYKKGSKPFY